MSTEGSDFMTINGADIIQYHAILLSKHIQPAAVTTYADWLRHGLTPLNYGQKETFKIVKLTIYLEDTSEDAAADDISNLMTALKTCTLKFDDLEKYFDCTVADSLSDPDTMIRPGVHQLDVTLNSAYAYLPPVTVSLPGQSGTVTAQGNLPSPAIVTLTPTQDIGSVTLSGLTKKPITVSSLHAGAPVTIDGEAGLVTEPDLDTIMTSAMGAGKWLFRKYSAGSMLSPDTADPEIAPTYDTITAGGAYTQQLIADTADLYHGKGGYDYIGHLKTGVYAASAKSITFTFYHDDGVSVYLNGAVTYSCPHVEAPGAPIAGWNNPAAVTLNLQTGWNKIEFIWIQHYGDDGIWAITPVMAGQVDQLNAFYARDTSPGGSVNKFPEADMWAWPAVQPGTQAVFVSSPACGVGIQYKPKFM